MISYRGEIVRSWVRREASARSLAQLLGMGTPTTLRDIVLRMRQVETLSRSLDINTDDDTPINGHVAMELRSNGDFVFSGHMRATGATSYHFTTQAWMKTPAGPVVTALAKGRVFGTDTPGDRQRNWNEPGNNPGITENWRELRASASLGYTMHAELSGILGGAVDVLKFLATGAVAAMVLGPAGWYVVIGNELTGVASDLASPDILAGIAVGGGVLLLLGPFGLVPAIIAGVATASLVDIKHRKLHDHEKDFAREVFGDTIRYDDVVVTNMLGTDNNKFTWPSIGNKILVNLGPDAFDSPKTWADVPGTDYTRPGEVFIHELTHAWQMSNMSLIRVMCNMNETYDYRTGDANWGDRSWTSFSNEQQAHIVDDWYGSFVGRLNSVDAQRDPAFRFIRDNIRAGNSHDV
ncbi:MAG TPA: hypothetical protein VJP84_04045 [Steroidobacteraceae bacterium]|jgi:hypothetical protein|nr:hypothetical protein [Steroidobacteraceae bacterium]